MTPAQRAALFSFILSTAAAVVPVAAPPLTPLLLIPPAVNRIVNALHVIDIPRQWRRLNWTGNRREGSCVHAAIVHLLHWQGQHQLANRWQTQYANGETAEGLARKLEANGVRFAETTNGDEAFLAWAMRTRRGAAVVVQNGAHMVNLVGLDQTEAHILDSNFPNRVSRIPRDAFLADWHASGGWAVTPVGTPTPPDPWIVIPRSHPNSER